MLQEQIDTKGGWVEVELPKDESFIKIEVDGEFTGRYTGTKKNPNFPDEKIHVFQINDDSIRQMNGATNLDRWMEQIEPGTNVKIKRLKDKKTGKAKPLHMFKVWKWEEK